MNATAIDKLTIIMDAINAGKTVYIGTYLHCWKVTAKTLDRWTKAGIELFKVKGNSLYMAFGKRYDCIDFCAIKIV